MEKYSYFSNEKGDYTIASNINNPTEELLAICFEEKDAKLVTNALNAYKVPKSEQLEQKASEEDNDLKSLGILGQAVMDKRLETWKDWEVRIISSNKVRNYLESSAKGCTTLFIYTENKEDLIVDYYPKADKLLIRKNNEWIKPGIKWLIDNLIDKKDV